MTLKKFCAKSNCSNLCDVGQLYCKNHNYLIAHQKTERNKQYDKMVRHRRDKQYAEFYHSPEWIRTRAYVLAKYKGLDLYAYYVDSKVVFATTVHHIVEIKDDWDLRLEISNLFPLSEQNHNKIHALYKSDKLGTQKLLKELIERWKREMKG